MPTRVKRHNHAARDRCQVWPVPWLVPKLTLAGFGRLELVSVEDATQRAHSLGYLGMLTMDDEAKLVHYDYAITVSIDR